VSDHDENSHAVNRYEASGIEERHGIVPTWLLVVYVSLGVWMVWYTLKFWADQG
jgi:hypothetical protein